MCLLYPCRDEFRHSPSSSHSLFPLPSLFFLMCSAKPPRKTIPSSIPPLALPHLVSPHYHHQPPNHQNASGRKRTAPHVRQEICTLHTTFRRLLTTPTTPSSRSFCLPPSKV
ncbi:hypothetical protein CCHR01_12532 [Colletotrichum chrysophilum]|uniref:Uncharacterized protein n=1 Tax=Colletotrichum chrysophilum TaxID=1836956 RepID=A0AAD9EE29_9PEZI|nr:hypothetical protein CCHR01_12532 [Colletotrichum chrysophilum]